MSILDPIFNLLAWLLEFFYDLVPSYGFAIIALTTLVLVVLSPLTYRSTKSMVSMRRLQPQIKRLQKRHKNDRETLNAEMMKLYQEHNVSPLSGCLPILVQSPVFIVMFRVIRGITRRSSDIGFAAGGNGARIGELTVRGEQADVDVFTDTVVRNFNPEYLSRDPGEESQLYLDLIQDNEMNWIGIDLSRTPFEVVTNSLGQALPYVLMVVIVAFLGWYQQRQIQGRMTGEISSQQQMIMRIIPWMLPIFAITMPAGLVLYFIVSAMLRIAQQAYITRTVYQNEELNKPIEFDDEDDDEDDDDGEPENPLAALFGGGAKSSGAAAKPAASARHGSRRPTSGSAPRNRPSSSSSSKGSAKSNGAKSNGAKNNGAKNNGAKSNGAKGDSGKKSSKNASKSNGSKSTKGNGSEEKFSAWGRAKRSAPKKDEAPEKPVSRRVTPKGDNRPDRRGKK